MLARLMQLIRKNIHRSPSTSDVLNRVEGLYRQKGYLAAYSEHTDLRVALNPHEAVGGLWEEIGKLQFNFLINHGLLPTHKFLDIGCGTLRGGRHFIKYLGAKNYAGLDISRKAVEYGKALVREEGLADKQPRLLISKNRDLTFKEFSGETFDYLLAQSVFTHLMPQHIEECFQNIGGIMGAQSTFFFTFHEGPAFLQLGLKDFSYPLSFFESLAEKYRFRLADYSAEYDHPRDQKMVGLSKLSESQVRDADLR